MNRRAFLKALTLGAAAVLDSFLNITKGLAWKINNKSAITTISSMTAPDLNPSKESVVQQTADDVISMKDLFSRRGIENEVISFRTSLTNHVRGLEMGLREAHTRFFLLRGSGRPFDCRSPDKVIIYYGRLHQEETGHIIPSWVPVSPSETRIVEGILIRSRITHEDFPLKPWHTYYDWLFDVYVDKQYSYLLSDANALALYRIDGKPRLHCEWDTAFFPSWAWPQEESRVWMVGRWIYDCSHPQTDSNGRTLMHTEFHPVKAVASFRTEAVLLPGNNGPTRVNQAVVYIGRKGGYWNHNINDQDYAFDLYLPPKPYPEAEPRWSIQPMTVPLPPGEEDLEFPYQRPRPPVPGEDPPTPRLPVDPIINPFPSREPRALRVVIPLKGVQPQPDNYGVIISGGWSDPRSTESSKIIRVRVTIEKIFMDANLDPRERDDWFVYIGVNGRWRTWRNLYGNSATLNYSVVLNLHPEDTIRISAKGFEGDPINTIIGRDTGLSWQTIVDHRDDRFIANKIKDAFISGIGLGNLITWGEDIQNDPLERFWEVHRPNEQGSFIRYSWTQCPRLDASGRTIIIEVNYPIFDLYACVNQYRLAYRIERL